MALTLIAMPIGAPEEISKAAMELIPTLDILICETRKETARILRGLGISVKEYRELNEHSGSDDLEELLELCRNSNVGLVSDCGTPGFCDPGARLVRRCRDKGVLAKSLPGPSSLMAFFSVCGYRVDEFYFKGFLSANTEERKTQIQKLKKETKVPVILMDTPYRMGKLLKELSEYWPESYLVLGTNLGAGDELVAEGNPSQLEKKFKEQKAEFILLLSPNREVLLKGFS